jgi:hypothetical protein
VTVCAHIVHSARPPLHPGGVDRVDVVHLELTAPALLTFDQHGRGVCHVDAQHQRVHETRLLGAPVRVLVRVYAVQRKPVATGRGASGLAGRPPGGSSSL